MYKYFKNVNTLDELKAAYRKLSMQHHPDLGGDLRTMQEINDEHDRLFEVLKHQHNERVDEAHQTTESPEEFRNIVDILCRMDGLEIELCGCWLWIGGETMKNKDGLKAAGCKWSANKKKWYWRHEENGRRWNRRKHSMDYIRGKYGSQWIDGAGATATERRAMPANA